MNKLEIMNKRRINNLELRMEKVERKQREIEDRLGKVESRLDKLEKKAPEKQRATTPSQPKRMQARREQQKKTKPSPQPEKPTTPKNSIRITVNNPTPYYVGIGIDNKPVKVVKKGDIVFEFNDGGQHLFRFYLLRTLSTPYGLNVKRPGEEYMCDSKFLNVGDSYTFNVPKVRTTVQIEPWEVIMWLPLKVIIGKHSYGNSPTVTTHLYPDKYRVRVNVTEGGKYNRELTVDYLKTKAIKTLATATIDVFPGNENNNAFFIRVTKPETGALYSNVLVANKKGQYIFGKYKIQLGDCTIYDDIKFHSGGGYEGYPMLHIVNIPAGTYPFRIFVNGELAHSGNVKIREDKTTDYSNKVWRM